MITEIKNFLFQRIRYLYCKFYWKRGEIVLLLDSRSDHYIYARIQRVVFDNNRFAGVVIKQISQDRDNPFEVWVNPIDLSKLDKDLQETLEVLDG
jgi:hypothetical protein